MKLLVLGAGGIGGYYGGRLAAAGSDVTFLVRAKRQQQIEQHGLCIESPLGDLRLPVQTLTTLEGAPHFDLVLLTCKAYDLAAATASIAPAVSGGCVIVPMLNGVAHFDALDRAFGPDHVMGGTCAIDVTLRPDGIIRHSGTLQRLTFGERDGRRSDRADAFARELARTSIEWELSNDIERNIWEKLVFLSVLAAGTCLFRANVREIMAAPGGAAAMEDGLASTVEIATREGHPPSPAAIAFAHNRLTDPTGPWSASMLRDLEAGGPVESDHIVGWMLDRARRHGIDAPLLSAAYTHLKAYEARRAAGRLPTSAQ
jgi:2-dehydropantoate 2-reductase